MGKNLMFKKRFVFMKPFLLFISFGTRQWLCTEISKTNKVKLKPTSTKSIRLQWRAVPKVKLLQVPRSLQEHNGSCKAFL